MPHLIRLRGPWQYEPLAFLFLCADGTQRIDTQQLPPAGSCRLPHDWAESFGGDFRGRVRYRRRFGRPTGLGPGDRVDLVLERVDAMAHVTMNGEPLGAVSANGQAARFDISELLERRNELCVDVDLPQLERGAPPLPRGDRQGKPTGWMGEVRLEIFGER